MCWLLTISTSRQDVPSIAPHSSPSLWFVSSLGSLFLGQKTAGGDMVTWVGFELLHSSYQLGISQRRAAWFIKWTRTTAEQETEPRAKFEEGLGRAMYVTSALEHERPFMAPLCKFMTIHPRHSVQAVPSYVAFFLRFLAGQAEHRRHCARCRPCRRQQLREWCTGVSGANRNRRLAPVRTVRWTCGRLGGLVWS